MNHRISVTQINMIQRCQVQWVRKYVHGESIPPGIAMLRGGSVHTGCEENFKQKIETHQDLKRDHIAEISVEAFKAQLKGDYELNSDEQSEGAGIVISRTTDAVAALSGAYAEEIAPRHQPIAVEHEISFQIGEDVSILGYVDWINEAKGLWDLKNTAMAPSVESDIQLSMYAVGYFREFGEYPHVVGIEQVKQNRPKKDGTCSVSTAQYPSIRGDDDTEALANRIDVVVEVMEGLRNEMIRPVPAIPGQWWCTPKFCGYYRTCKHVNRNVV